jgi:hypothetical protein
MRHVRVSEGGVTLGTLHSASGKAQERVVGGRRFLQDSAYSERLAFVYLPSSVNAWTGPRTSGGLQYGGFQSQLYFSGKHC